VDHTNEDPVEHGGWCERISTEGRMERWEVGEKSLKGSRSDVRRVGGRTRIVARGEKKRKKKKKKRKKRQGWTVELSQKGIVI
jgi:hypothetical protein